MKNFEINLDLNAELLPLGDALELDLVVVGAVSIAPACAKYLGSARLSPAGGGIFWVSPSSKLGFSSPARATCQFLGPALDLVPYFLI